MVRTDGSGSQATGVRWKCDNDEVNDDFDDDNSSLSTFSQKSRADCSSAQSSLSMFYDPNAKPPKESEIKKRKSTFLMQVEEDEESEDNGEGSEEESDHIYSERHVYDGEDEDDVEDDESKFSQEKILADIDEKRTAGVDSSSSNTTQNKKETEWWPSIDNDEFQSFLSTESLKNYGFRSDLWPILKKLKWKFVTKGKYYCSPNAPLLWLNIRDQHQHTKTFDQIGYEDDNNANERQVLLFQTEQDVLDSLDGTIDYHLPSAIRSTGMSEETKTSEQLKKENEWYKQRLATLKQDILKIIYIQRKRHEALWWPSANDDELKSFLLTQSLSEYKFVSALWTIMHTFLKWKYTGGSYQSPEAPLRWLTVGNQHQCTVFYNQMTDFAEHDNISERSKNSDARTNETANNANDTSKSNINLSCLTFPSAKDIQECLDGVKEYVPFNGTSLSDLEKKLYRKRIKAFREDILKLLFILSKRSEQAHGMRGKAIESSLKINLTMDDRTNGGNPMENKNDKNASFNENRRTKYRKTMDEVDPGATCFISKGKKYKQSKYYPDLKSVCETQSMSLRDDDNLPSNIDSTIDKEIDLDEKMSPAMVDEDDDKLLNEEEKYVSHYDDWRFLVATKHSLIFYGFGNKEHLLNHFAAHGLSKDGDVLLLNGYDLDFSISVTLDIIVQSFLNGVDPYTGFENKIGAFVPSCEDLDMKVGDAQKEPSLEPRYPLPVGCSPLYVRTIMISQKLSRSSSDEDASKRTANAFYRDSDKVDAHLNDPIYIVIHNIDGPALWDPLTQRCLAALVTHSKCRSSGRNRIRIVASIDHVNAPANLWDNDTYDDFAWMWTLVETKRPYDASKMHFSMETSSSSEKRGKVGRRRSRSALLGLENVLTSLAPRHAEVLKEVAKIQLSLRGRGKGGRDDSDDDGDGEGWVAYSTLLKACQERMLVYSDTQLRALLNELTDHEIIIHREDKNGRGLILIASEEGTDCVKMVLDFCR